MIEKVIESFILNFKKYLYAVIGLITGTLIVEYGIVKAIFILLISVLGFKLGDAKFTRKIREQILEKFKE